MSGWVRVGMCGCGCDVWVCVGCVGVYVRVCGCTHISMYVCVLCMCVYVCVWRTCECTERCQ